MASSLAALVAMAREGQPFKPIQIDGGATQGRLLPQAPPPVKNNEVVKKKPKGKSYALKFQGPTYEDEDEDLRQRFLEQMTLNADTPGLKHLTGVDDVTSLATQDLDMSIAESAKDPNDVYTMYNFEKPEKSDLQIHKYKHDILRQIDVHTVTIIKGPTGCGKTTQVPLFILDENREKNIYCNIIVTQPRKIAATSIAQRVCKERRWNVGTVVGYQISLEKRTTEDTRLTYVTAGVLLQKLVNGSYSNYTHIIVDEVHERECETDFMLIVLKQLIKLKLFKGKLILMSATMTGDKFSNYFTRRFKSNEVIQPPVIDLPLETNFAVQITYLDALRTQEISEVATIDKPSIPASLYYYVTILIGCFHSLDHKSDQDGAVLIFLPGVVEIDTMNKTLTNCMDHKDKWFICPLHSTMSFEEQMKVFASPPTGFRKIILATNIAESSITVPDVKYVIDFCLTKRQFQDKNTFYSSLQLCWVSKSQADQRAGRVGRTMSGLVYRLVPAALYEEFDEDSPPEIVRCPLDRLVLKAKELNVDTPVNILGRAMDPPDLSNIERTILNLKELGALSLYSNGVYDEQDGDLTFTGKVMAGLPLDTQLSKLILIGHMFSVVRECVKMACCMSGKNIFTSPLNRKMESYNTKLGWEADSRSDPITALNLYKVWRLKSMRGQFMRSGGEKEEQWASRNFAQLKSLKEVEKLEIEVLERLKKMGIVDQRSNQIKEVDERIISFILKVCLAGACYPNFFPLHQIDEEEAVRTLCQRDPCRTVFFKNFPQNQPGPLYRDCVKKLLDGCGSGIKVHFDRTTKVYVEFDSSMIPHETRETDYEQDVPIPGRVIKAVYRAIKMRHLDMPMKIPLLNHTVAEKRAQQIFGADMYTSAACAAKVTKKEATKFAPLNRMPLLNQTFVSLNITHIVNPSNFYAVLKTDLPTGHWIQKTINDGRNSLVSLCDSEIVPGTLCLAKYEDHASGSVEWYRAKIVAVSNSYGGKKIGTVTVYFVDWGNYRTLTDFKSDLRGYGPEMVEQKLREQPPMCVRCRLAEITPTCKQGFGEWSKEAIESFRKAVSSYECDAKIYSVVGDTMAVLIYPSKLRPANFFLPLEESVNFALVQAGFAVIVEEPMLSKENHERREMIASRKDGEVYYSGSNENSHHQWINNIQFDSPNFEEGRVKQHKLLGPYSPLEMTPYPITRKCRGKSVTVDWNSINSVLINENPVDTSQRIIVAGTVSQSQNNTMLTLRNTTLMPCIRGISGILAMLFAPRVELRVDQDMTTFTGALCGLGYDDNGRSYDQENDVEMTFDCKIELEDIQLINKLRFWMERILCRSIDGHVVDHAVTETGIIDVQNTCLGYLLSLFSKTRDPLCIEFYSNQYEWNQVPFEYLMSPVKDPQPARVYELIWGVSLKTQSPAELRTSITRNLETIRVLTTGAEQMKKPTICILCQKYFENVRSLDIHTKSKAHCLKVADFEGKPFGQLDRDTEQTAQQQRCLRHFKQSSDRR